MSGLESCKVRDANATRFVSYDFRSARFADHDGRTGLSRITGQLDARKCYSKPRAKEKRTRPAHAIRDRTPAATTIDPRRTQPIGR